jgi:SulP family sulfate permease
MERLKIDPKTIGQDFVAGLTLSVESIPDGMASAVLAGVNPIYGLNTLMVATPIGAIFTSSVYMNVAMTSAMALVINSTLAPLAGDLEAQAASLFALALMTGVFMLVLGLLKGGALLRFVPHSVMVGFMTAVAILIILGQLGALTGYESEAGNKVLQTIDLIFNFNQIHVHTFLIGLITAALIVILDRFTKLGGFGLLVAVVVAAILVKVLGWDSVVLVKDIAEIPSSLPRPMLPQLALIPGLILPAVSIGIIGLIQGAGISQSYPNPDGKYPDASADFSGQGIANIAVSFFQGIPAAGSVSGTALVVNAGARSRWANIIAGLLVAVIILVFASAVSELVMASLAALLIVAALQSINVDDFKTVWATGRISQVTMFITLVMALIVPLHIAVLVGIAISTLLFVVRQSNTITVSELSYEKDADFPFVTQDVPDELPGREVTALTFSGSLFFAAATSVEEQLPKADDAKQAAVILVLRNRKDIGSTIIGVIERYAQTIRDNQGCLMLADVEDHALEQMERVGLLEQLGEENVFGVTRRVGEGFVRAFEAAEAWLADQPPLVVEEDNQDVTPDSEEEQPSS